MIPVDGIENFPLMGRAIFQKAAKTGDFFEEQVIFRSAWARLMAGRSKHVRYDIDGSDMPEGVGCLRLRSSRIDLPSSSNDSKQSVKASSACLMASS
jgi:hypothetical protein